MADQNNLELTKKMYATLCAALDERQWKYRRNDEEMAIEYIVNGDDIPMRFIIRFDAERTLVRFFSPLPLSVREDKRLEMAVALSIINNCLVAGCFELDMKDGELRFRVCNSFRDSVLSADVFLHLLQLGIDVVERYNDKLFMLATGVISLEKFVELYNEGKK